MLYITVATSVSGIQPIQYAIKTIQQFGSVYYIDRDIRHDISSRRNLGVE